MSYQRNEVDAPRTAGFMLKLLAGLAENAVTAGLMAKAMFPKVGITLLRQTPALESAIYRVPVATSKTSSAAARASDPVKSAAALPMPPADFPWTTSADFVNAYVSGATTPTEVARVFLAKLAELDAGTPPMRWFISQNPDDLLAQAEASTARYRAGAPLGPLDGVPVAVKDELNQAGYRTTVGTSFLGTSPAAADASAVERLRKAGALLVGKTNMHEIGIGVTGLNPHHGTARNPYDPARATGGSSSGSAATVASGLCPIAVGADGGGSIRIPASLCGAVGLKPTFARVSEFGVAPVCWSVAHAGPLATCVRDLALAYAIMAGHDPNDPLTLAAPPVHLPDAAPKDLSGVRIGVFKPWFEDADPEVVAGCYALLEHFKKAGATVIEVDIPDMHLVAPVHVVTIVTEMVAAVAEHDAEHRKHFALDTRLNLALGRQLTAADFVTAQRLRNRIRDHFDTVLNQVDLLVTPTTAITAPVHPLDALPDGESDMKKTVAIMRFAQPGNLTGYPAISLPGGYDGQGMPIGFQAMGRAYEEELLLRLALVAEGVVRRKAPAVHVTWPLGKT